MRNEKKYWIKRLTIFFLLALISSYLISVKIISDQKEIVLERNRLEMLRLTEIVGGEISNFLQQTENILVGIGKFFDEEDYQNPYQCSKILEEFFQEINNHAAYLNIGILNPEGKIICSAIPFQEPIFASDRYYFIKALENKEMALGLFQIGRIINQPSLNIAYPLLDKESNVKGVIFIALNLKYFKNLIPLSPFLQDTEIVITDRNNTILFYYPSELYEKYLGKTYQLEKKKLSSLENQSTFEGIGLNNKDSVFASTQIPKNPESGYLKIFIGLSKEKILEKVNQRAVKNLILYISLFSLAFTFAWIISKVIAEKTSTSV
ncbi:MAG: cache domain-containing protein [Patescibacteria group bacterium]|nr:cache domain-containing protein [Patescibacteria group bacterium]